MLCSFGPTEFSEANMRVPKSASAIHSLCRIRPHGAAARVLQLRLQPDHAPCGRRDSLAVQCAARDTGEGGQLTVDCDDRQGRGSGPAAGRGVRSRPAGAQDQRGWHSRRRRRAGILSGGSGYLASVVHQLTEPRRSRSNPGHMFALVFPDMPKR